MPIVVYVVLIPTAVGAALGLVLALRFHGHDIAFDRTVGDQLDELPDLIANARQSVLVVTDFEPRFFGEEATQKAFERALHNGADVRFLTDGDPLPWYLQKSDVLGIKQVSAIGPHVTVIDRQHVRLETDHTHCRFGDGKGDLGLVFQDFPQLAARYAEEFESTWISRA